MFTTSNALPGTILSWFRSVSFQRVSAAPLMNQLLPLSATIIPYFFNAFSTTRAWPVYPDTSKLAFSRSRSPIGGRFGSVDDDA